ncbi:MAG: CocE/NonD family hydrolase, partial [Chloroflexota bacterium]
QDYNLVAFDQRNNGRSGGTLTTMGYAEQNDVEAIVDWLVKTKAPTHIGVLANSMGSPAVLGAAIGDPRIEAVLLDSAHAHLMNVVARRLPVHEGQPSYPGAWAIVLGTDVRVGTDVTAVDPANLIPKLGSRPLLLTHGAADRDDVPAESAEVNRAAAEAAGINVTLKYCDGADHGKVVDVCPDAFGRWATDFFASAFGTP